MNVDYKDLNCTDVGRALKLDKSTIAAWCRKGYIAYQDVSEPGSKRPRYLIPEWEFDRIHKLIRKYGRRKWFMYNNNKDEVFEQHVADVSQKEEPQTAVVIPANDVSEKVEESQELKTTTSARIQFNISINKEDKQLIEEGCKRTGLSRADYIRKLLYEENKTPQPVIITDVPTTTPHKRVDVEKLTNTASYMQDIYDRLDDLEAERNQLLNELEICRKDINSYI